MLPLAAGGKTFAGSDMQESDPVNGHTIAHYRVLKRLGGGGMDVLYKAEDPPMPKASFIATSSPRICS
jgi:hypothetical protein